MPSQIDADLRMKWEKAMKILFGIDIKCHQPFICSDHFDPNDLTIRKGGKALKTGAVPSIGIKTTVKS